MWQLAAAFAGIALRRRGPDSLPDSGFLVALLLGVSFPIYLVEYGFYRPLDLVALLLFAIDAIVLFLYVYGVLAYFRLERRFRQTIAAMLGVYIFVTLAFMPIAALATLAGQDLSSVPLASIQAGFFFWQVYISATILARSLSQSLLVGLGFEILYICLTLFIAVTISPDVSGLESPAV